VDGEQLVRGIALGIDITERKQAEQALSEYARQQTALYALADALQQAQSQEQVYDAALGAILNALQCDRASFLLLVETDLMHFVAWRGLSEEYRKATDGHSPWQPEEKNPEPICIVDIEASDLSDALKAAVKAEGIGSLAFIPLLSDGELIGKFMVYFDTRHACSDAEIDLSRTIAHQLAAAIKRKRAEEALRASETLYRTIARSIPGGGVYVVDKEFRYLVAEGSVTEAFGLTREMLEGHTVAEAFPDGRAERMEARLRKNFAGETVSFETVHNGHVFWTQQAPIADSLGQVIIVTLDITERKQMELALRQSEERFARFMQYLPGLAWIKNVDGRYVYANDAAEKAFGIPREQLYGRSDPEVFDPEVAAHFMKNDQQALTAGKGVQVIETLPQEDGVVHHSLVTKFPILGSDGNALLIGGTAFDITDRIQMEDALREARERAESTANRVARLQQVTASLAGAATPARLAELMLEQGTRATGASASILRELVNEGQMLKTIAALGYPTEAVRIEPVPLSARTAMSDSILTKEPIWLGSHAEFADQYPALAESRARLGFEAMVALPLMVGDQVLGGLAFSFVEKREFATEEREFLLAVAQQCAQGLERVRGAEALRQSEGRYRALVNQATAGIVRKDPNGKMLFVNEAFCEMLGYRPEELVGQTMWQFTHPEDVLENRRLFNRLMQEGTPFRLEKRLLHRDGSILWATVSVSPVLDADGKPESAVSVYADITERKQAEVDLNESRERFRNLFNLVPVAVYTCDADGLIQEFNRSAIELWGREPIRNDPSERYCGSFKIYYPDGRFMPHRSCPMARILRGETLDPSELEIVVERRDGSRRLVIAHPLALRNERGKIIGAINCLYDLTERKQAESRLALLAQVSDLTRIYEDPLELMSAVADLVGQHFQARRCLFNEINLEDGLEIVHHDYHDGIESVEGVHKLSEYSSLMTAEIMAGKTIVNHDSQIDSRTAIDYERIYRRTGERAYVAVPLMRAEEWAATLWISDDLPRQWSDEEVALLQAVAERAWTAAEKLRIDAELRDSEERLRVTFNTTAVGFATLKPDLHFVEVNDAFCAITGYPREMLVKMDSYSLTHPAYQEDARKQIAQLIAGEVPSSTIEKIDIRRDGTEIWVQNSVSLVRDAEGAPLHLIVICQDVTERKRAEEALQRLNQDLERLNLELEQRVMMRTAELSATNEHLLEEIEERAMVEEALRESDATTRLILDTSPDAVVITNRDGRIMRVNAQIDHLFGYKQEEVLGEKIEILIPERFHNQHVEHRAYYNRKPHRRPMGIGLELFGQRRDGTEFSVDVTLTPILNQNIADWDTMVTIRDSTERKRMEAELRESHKRLQMLSQRLVEVQEEERRAIARELHDRVGQSLAALNLNLTIVSNELSSVVDEQVNLRLADSMQLLAEVIALVRDVMADLRPAVLDDYGLEAALHTTLERFRSRFGMDIRFEKNQSLIPRLGPSLEMTLLRIAQEAIVNAGRHANADQVNLLLQLEPNMIRLIIQDNGVGIQSWEQANRPGNHGLTIMRERAEAVGGKLTIASTPGQGTRIEVSMPVQYQNPKE
jgi:PAS domain S-box-containing protein